MDVVHVHDTHSGSEATAPRAQVVVVYLTESRRTVVLCTLCGHMDGHVSLRIAFLICHMYMSTSMQGLYILAACASLAFAVLVAWLRREKGRLWHRVSLESNRLCDEFESQVAKLAELADGRIAAAIDSARAEMSGHIDSRAEGLLAEAEVRIQAAEAAVRAQVNTALKSAEGPLVEQVRAAVAQEAEAKLQAGKTIIEEAEKTLARLESARGKALNTARTIESKVADWRDDDDDEDDEGGMSETFMKLASHLPPEVRKGIIDHAPPETRAQVNLLFASADARAPPTAQQPAAPTAPVYPSGIVV